MMPVSPADDGGRAEGLAAGVAFGGRRDCRLMIDDFGIERTASVLLTAKTVIRRSLHVFQDHDPHVRA